MNVVCIDNVHWHALRFGFDSDDFPNLQFDPIPCHFSVTWPWERGDSNEANRNAILTQYDIQAEGGLLPKRYKKIKRKLLWIF